MSYALLASTSLAVALACTVVVLLLQNDTNERATEGSLTNCPSTLYTLPPQLSECTVNDTLLFCKDMAGESLIFDAPPAGLKYAEVSSLGLLGLCPDWSGCRKMQVLTAAWDAVKRECVDDGQWPPLCEDLPSSVDGYMPLERGCYSVDAEFDILVYGAYAFDYVSEYCEDMKHAST